MAQECRASIAHRIAYIFRDALRRLDSPLLSVQRKARARLPVAAKHAGFPRHAATYASHESVRGKCCECVTRIRHGKIHRSPVYSAHEMARSTPAFWPAHVRRTTRDVASRKAASGKAAWTRQTNRPPCDGFDARRRMLGVGCRAQTLIRQ
jgi:hypothetical protein